MTLVVDPCGLSDLDELLAFALVHQHEMVQSFPAIIPPDDTALRSQLERLLTKGHGVIARTDAGVVGCMIAYGPIADFRPGHFGTYGPLSSCLVADTDTDRIFTTMLTAFGNLPDFRGVQMAAFTCCTNNAALNSSFVQNGFGLRCADAIASIESLPTDVGSNSFTIEKVSMADALSLREVKQALALHLASSPTNQELFDFSPEFIAWKTEQRQSVHFAARDGDQIIGFIEATFHGENYLTTHPDMRNICGAGVLPGYRNRGVMRALLVELVENYRAEGISTIGVDYETQNPNARGFWERYFTPYTWSWERHYDMPWGSL